MIAQSSAHAGWPTSPCFCFDLSWICVNVYCRRAKVSVVVAREGKWGCGYGWGSRVGGESTC